MSYVQKTLGRGEEIRFVAVYNWTFSFMPVVWFALGAAPSLMYLFLQYRYGLTSEELRQGWWFAWAALALGSLRLVTHMITLWTTEFIVTSNRFVYKHGWIRRSTQEVSLTKIEEIVLEQTVLGRIFGFGKLVLHGTGVGKIELPNIDDPIRVRREIENARANLIGDRRQQDDD